MRALTGLTMEQNMATVRVELSPQMLDELSFSSSVDVCQAETFVCLISNYSNKPGPPSGPSAHPQSVRGQAGCMVQAAAPFLSVLVLPSTPW